LTPQEMDLLSTMASQTAVAMEKAQLFDRDRRKSAQLSAITQVSKKIVTIHSVDVLLQQTSRLTEETFAVERVQVLLADEAETAQADPAATDIPVLYRGESIGDLRVWLRPGTGFSPDDLSMLQTLADEIAVAIENARLYENLQRQMAMLEQTQFQLMQSAKLATIGELAAFVAHEINNPLTSVLGYASLILSETPPDDSTREVRGNGTGPQVEIAFQDGGVGIPEDKLERIFDPFFTTKEDGKGTGLGLPISKRIVERHGGSISVKSVVGAGTRFTVALPVAVTYS